MDVSGTAITDEGIQLLLGASKVMAMSGCPGGDGGAGIGAFGSVVLVSPFAGVVAIFVVVVVGACLEPFSRRIFVFCGFLGKKKNKETIYIKPLSHTVFVS